MPDTPMEDLLAGLERLDIGVEDTFEIEKFKGALKDALGYDPTDEQVDVFFGTQKGPLEYLASQGVRPITIDYKSGQQTRYVWKGKAGLWGFDSINEAFELE